MPAPIYRWINDGGQTQFITKFLTAGVLFEPPNKMLAGWWMRGFKTSGRLLFRDKMDRHPWAPGRQWYAAEYTCLICSSLLARLPLRGPLRPMRSHAGIWSAANRREPAFVFPRAENFLKLRSSTAKGDIHIRFLFTNSGSRGVPCGCGLPAGHHEV